MDANDATRSGWVTLSDKDNRNIVLNAVFLFHDINDLDVFSRYFWKSLWHNEYKQPLCKVWF